MKKLVTTMNIEFKSTIFSPKKNLSIDNDFRLICADSNNQNSLIFNKEDITGIRYGLSWIKGYQFTIGRVYCIEIRNKENKIISIKLRTVYGIRKGLLWKKYSEIVDAIYEAYFIYLYNLFVDEYNQNGIVEIEGIIISKEGILVKKNKEIINWDDLEIGIYYHYLSLTSKKNSRNYTQLYYLNEWNIYLIQNLVETIMERKNIT